MKEQDQIITKEKTGKVYKITNPKGRIYIGSTSNKINNRWKSYKNLNCVRQFKIYNSLKKYGFENHIFEVIWEGDIKYMRRLEWFWGHHFNVLDEFKGLNLRLPGEDDNYQNVSDETRRKLSIAHLGKIISIETRKKQSEAKKGKKGTPCTEENKKRTSERSKGKKYSYDVRKRKSESMKGELNFNYGKPKSKKFKKHMSLLMTGRILSEKSKILIAEYNYKKIICKETNEIFKSIKHASEYYKVSHSCISDNIHGRTKKTKFKLSFKFLEIENQQQNKK